MTASKRHSNERIYERRRRFASQFNVSDGGRYVNDWVEQIDALLEQLEVVTAERDELNRLLQGPDRVGQMHKRVREMQEQLEAAKRACNAWAEKYDALLSRTVERELADELKEQFDTLKRQADFDAERAAILSAAVGRARLVLNDASTETTRLLDEALTSNPASRDEA